MTLSAPNVLMLGIGNLLWADEGFGVRVLEQLHAQYQFPDNVELLDGGTQEVFTSFSMSKGVDILIVFDAVDYGLAPGTLKRVENDAVPQFMGAKKMSLHQTGFQEVLAMAALLGRYPQHLLLLGVQPVELEDFGGSLRPAVKAQIEPVIQITLDYLKGFGIEATPRATTEIPPLAPHALNLQAYENQRPSEAEACRPR